MIWDFHLEIDCIWQKLKCLSILYLLTVPETLNSDGLEVLVWMQDPTREHTPKKMGPFNWNWNGLLMILDFHGAEPIGQKKKKKLAVFAQWLIPASVHFASVRARGNIRGSRASSAVSPMLCCQVEKLVKVYYNPVLARLFVAKTPQDWRFALSSSGVKHSS